MIAVLSTLAIAMGYLTFVVKRLVSNQDRLLPLIFGFMTASLVFYTLYYSVIVITQYRLQWLVSGLPSYACSITYLAYTGSLLLIIGAILNLAKWI